jgi:hypothetical protein
MRIIFTLIGCTLLTCDMYMSDLRHIHDPVLSSLKMEGIRSLYFLCFPTTSTTRSHICAYVTRMNDNVSRSFEMRHVIHDIRISSGQWPRCDVKYGAVRCPRSYEISRTLDIYMSKIYKMQHLEGSVMPLLYIGRTVLKG